MEILKLTFSKQLLALKNHCIGISINRIKFITIQ